MYYNWHTIIDILNKQIENERLINLFISFIKIFMT